MFTRLQICRNKDGSTRCYLHLLNSKRVNGRTRQEFICTLGRLDILQAGGGLDRLIEGLARYSERQWVQVQALKGGWDKIYGPVLVFRRLWEHLGLAGQVTGLQTETEVQFPIDEAAFAMVLHRLMDPGSKRATYLWMKERVYRSEFDKVELHQLYRALGYLVQGKEKMEEALFLRNCDLFSLGVDLVLFDTTLVHFEGRGPAGLATQARPGNYPDCVKVLVGLVMTGDGFPVAHHVFPGNTADINAFRAALGDLRRRFPIRRVIIVADRGVVSGDVIEEMEQANQKEPDKKIDYIFGMRLRKCREVNEEVLSRAGRYHEVAENLRVKEVRVGDHRYVVCHNNESEERDRKRREEIIERARADLKKKGAKAFVMPRGLRRFVELVGGELMIREAIVSEEARYDGKWVLRTNTELPTDEVALAYKSLWQIEHAFRELKSGLEIRPVFLRTEDHVRGHILVCFLALVLEAALQRLLKEQGANGSYRDILNDLEGVRAVELKSNGKRWLVRTELPANAFEAFKAVGLRAPVHIQSLP
jgi:transposase